MTTGKTILIISISFSPIVGGVETHLDDLCDYLTKNGYRVRVITYGPAMAKTKVARGEKRGKLIIHRIPWFDPVLFHRLERYPLLEFLYMTPLLLLYSLFFMLACRGNIDVVHAHGLNAAFVAKALVKMFRKRSVVSIHAIYNLPEKPTLARLMRVTLSSFDVVLALAVRSKMELIRIGLDSSKIRVFTYWIDQKVFRPLNKAECKKILALEDKFVVLFVGRLIEIKGVRLLIEVAKRLSRMENIFFVFVGDGPLANELESVSKTLNNVSYEGRIKNRDLYVYYNAADVIVMPSLYEEGFGRVILEALSCATPVIASNRGGILEALDSSVGVFIEPTVYNIERNILYFYNNPSELLKLTMNCRKYAEKHFSERNAKRIEDSYYTKCM